MDPQKQGYWQKSVSSSAGHGPSAPLESHENSFATGGKPDHPMMQTLVWEASEYVHHEKDSLWYGGLAIVAISLIVFAIFVLRSWTFAVLIVVMVVAVIYFSLRPPRIVRYQLTSQGLDINGRHYGYYDFRAFGVVQDGMLSYITMLPVKRFSSSIDIYFPQEYGERIVDMIGAMVPMQVVEPDFVDLLTKKMRL